MAKLSVFDSMFLKMRPKNSLLNKTTSYLILQKCSAASKQLVSLAAFCLHRKKTFCIMDFYDKNSVKDSYKTNVYSR